MLLKSYFFLKLSFQRNTFTLILTFSLVKLKVYRQGGKCQTHQCRTMKTGEHNIEIDFFNKGLIIREIAGSMK